MHSSLRGSLSRLGFTTKQSKLCAEMCVPHFLGAFNEFYRAANRPVVQYEARLHTSESLRAAAEQKLARAEADAAAAQAMSMEYAETAAVKQKEIVQLREALAAAQSAAAATTATIAVVAAASVGFAEVLGVDDKAGARPSAAANAELPSDTTPPDGKVSSDSGSNSNCHGCNDTCVVS